MQTVGEIRAALQAAVPGIDVSVLINGSVSQQHSLVVDPAHAIAAARWLRDDDQLRLDYCSNAAGVDWPEHEITETAKVTSLVDGVEHTTDETRKRLVPGYLEAVYHLFSIARKHGPVILRMRTGDRGSDVHLPSLTPVWRSAELQEREIFDLYGIIFDGHPDLRRLLMWDEFEGHPMRKDYVAPDDDYLPLAQALAGEPV